MGIIDFLERLEKAAPCGEGRWMARCPAHEDDRASLSVRLREDGAILLFCHAGCAAEDVTAAMGLSLRDLFAGCRERTARPMGQAVPARKAEPAPEKPVPAIPAGAEAVYRYGPDCRKVRMPGKRFTWQHKNRAGQWVSGRGDGPHALYMPVPPEGHHTVVLVEGEKDADSLCALGLCAASGENGAGNRKWLPEYTAQLRGLRVLCLGDRDKVGRDYMAHAALKLSGEAAEVRLLKWEVLWPDCPEHGDISDMLAALGAEETLRRLREAWKHTGEYLPGAAAPAAGYEPEPVPPPEEGKALPPGPEETDREPALPPVPPAPGGGRPRIRSTIEACVNALESDPMLAGKLCRNELTGQTDILAAVPWKRRGGPAINEADECNLRLYLEQRHSLNREEHIRTALEIVASRHSYHPIRRRLEALTWDGTPRIAYALHHFLGAEESAYNAEVMRMHMTAAIARLYTPGCKYDLCLCLVGPQGGGKSTFFRLLALEDEWFSDDLRRFDDKEIYRKLQGHWIIELAEMSAIANARTLEETKAFLSRQKETYKVPYEKHPEDRPRQCVFCGTSNDLQFLPPDRSGNRRFAPVPVDPARAEVHPLADEKASRAYIEQMWAEAMHHYRSGHIRLHFTKEMEEYAAALRDDFMPEDTEAGQVERYLERHRLTRACIRQIWCEVFGHHETEEMPMAFSKRIAAVLRELGWTQGTHQAFGVYGKQRSWHAPAAAPQAFREVTEPDRELPF